jgi:hypothetical protein
MAKQQHKQQFYPGGFRLGQTLAVNLSPTHLLLILVAHVNKYVAARLLLHQCPRLFGCHSSDLQTQQGQGTANTCYFVIMLFC